MEDDTGFEIQPVEEHDVVEGADIGVLELVHLHIREVEGVAKLLLDQFFYGRVADTVTVTRRQLGISVTLRVVGHSQWRIEEELLDLEIIAEIGIQRQISVL